MDKAQEYMDYGMQLVMEFTPKLVTAILVLIIGLWVVRMITNVLDKAMERGNVDVSLRRFLHSLLNILLKALVIISVISMLGVETTSFIAILGAAGLAVGLALQGSLANFAGGVLILIFKPYKVGDFIDAQGHMGSVNSIQVFNTVLKTPDNKTIIIPNGAIAGGSITNFSTEPRRRVDWVFGIGYSDDIDKAKAVIAKLLENDERALKDPEPVIVVSELADSSVNITVRVWAEAADFWPLHFDMIERVKKAFDKVGISIPFPQRDVHMYQQGNGSAN